MDNVKLNIVESWEEAQVFMSWLGERRQVLACDTETTGLDWWTEHFVRLVQFGDLNTGWVIPFERWGGLAEEALKRYNGPLVFHNAKFDVKALEISGIPVKRHLVEDTRTMAHLIDPAHLTGLKDLGVRYVDSTCDNGQVVLKKGMLQNRWTWATVPVNFTPYWIYSALDPVLTAHLYKQFRPQIIGDLEEVYEMEIQILWILDAIEKKGVRVDVEYCIEQQSLISKQVDVITEWIRDNWDIGAGQNKLIAEILLKDGVKLTKKTKSKSAWAMDEDVLSGIDHPLARAALNVRKGKRAANNYFGSYIERQVDGLLHADINPLGARTGRMSVSKPPLQQIPHTKLLRDPFIPRNGNRLVSVDFEQVEYRLIAHLSEDPGLIAGFAGSDFFCALAAEVYGVPSVEKGDPRRQITKNTMYGVAYGAGEEKSALMTGIPQEEMAAFRTKFFNTYPGLKAYMRSVTDTAKRNEHQGGIPYVTTPMGRRQPADWFNEQWKYYALLNYQVQGAAGDVFKSALVEMDRAGLTEYMILPIHDEILLDVPAEDAEDVALETIECFEADKSWRVPLTADSKIVDRWGDAYREK
jgi:DNA polymerase-1